MSGAQNPVVNVLRFGFRTQGTVNPPIGGDYPHDARIAYGVPVRGLRFGRRPGSSSTVVAASFGIGAEILSGVARKAPSQIELQAGLIAKPGAQAEWSVAVSAKSAVDLEGTSSLTRKAATPLEFQAGAMAAKSAVAIEVTSSLIRKTAAPAEILAALSSRLAAPAEVLAGVAGRSLAVAEIQSTVNVVTALSRMPIEILGSVAASSIARPEFLGAIKAQSTAIVEDVAGVQSRRGSPLEAPAGVRAQDGAAAELVAAVRAAGAAPIELLTALARAFKQPIEVVASVFALTAKSLSPFEILGHAGASARVDVEIYSLAAYGHVIQLLSAIAEPATTLSAIAEIETNLTGIFGMPAALGQNVTIYPGDSRTLNFPIKKPDGTDPTFISPTASFIITKDYRVGPDALVMEGLPLTQVSSAWSLSVGLSTAATKLIPVGRYVHQVRVFDTDGTELTVALGFFLVQPIRPNP